MQSILFLPDHSVLFLNSMPPVVLEILSTVFPSSLPSHFYPNIHPECLLTYQFFSGRTTRSTEAAALPLLEEHRIVPRQDKFALIELLSLKLQLQSSANSFNSRWLLMRK